MYVNSDSQDRTYAIDIVGNRQKSIVGPTLRKRYHGKPSKVYRKIALAAEISWKTVKSQS